MTHRFRSSVAAIAALFTTLFLAGAASAQWTISRPGSYKLWANYSVASGDGIIITASDVTLDLNGFGVSTRTRGAGRGIVVQGGKGVSVTNGRVSGFMMNVMLDGSENTKVADLRITGDGLAPAGGPSEIGVVLLNSRACSITGNTVSSVNLGMLIRGPKTTGNRIMKNIVTGGATAANNLLGICYNPAPGTDPAGPRGDSIYNNHIARFGFGIAMSTGSVSNMFNDNTIASFTGTFREPQAFTAQGGTNVEFDNTAVLIPATDL